MTMAVRVACESHGVGRDPDGEGLLTGTGG
jgi:hypothetical protein